MFENIANFFKRLVKSEQQETTKSKDTAKERLHLVLMQDRANVSTDFLELMKQEIIEVIKKYIDVEEESIDVRLTNKVQEDGSNGAPFLYANIPIVKIKNEAKNEDSKVENKEKEDNKKEKEDKKESEEKENKEENEKEEIKKEDKEEQQEKEEIEKKDDTVAQEQKEIKKQKDKEKPKEKPKEGPKEKPKEEKTVKKVTSKKTTKKKE